MTLKLGKLPARPDAVKLRFSAYLPDKALPTPPAQFGWDHLIPSNAWGMLGNDQVGDCVIAGGLHETLLWRATAKHTTPLSTACAIKNYELITGYDPNDPSTDQGTDMQVAASYRRKTGLLDANGHRHKVGAYVALRPGDVQQLATATWLFGAVGIGIEFPAFAMDQFNNDQPWDVQRANSKIEGGHYIPDFGRGAIYSNTGSNIRVVTWGKVIEMTPRFYQKYCDEAIVYLSEEMLTKGVTLAGFNLAQLQDDLKQVAAA